MKPKRVSLGKTARPSLTGILPRERLFALLDEGREGSGLWISGPRHVVYFYPEASPRLAGNVLVWATASRTFRLEGRTLTRDDALRLAREIMGTSAG